MRAVLPDPAGPPMPTLSGPCELFIAAASFSHQLRNDRVYCASWPGPAFAGPKAQGACQQGSVKSDDPPSRGLIGATAGQSRALRKLLHIYCARARQSLGNVATFMAPSAVIPKPIRNLLRGNAIFVASQNNKCCNAKAGECEASQHGFCEILETTGRKVRRIGKAHARRRQPAEV